MGVAYGSCPSEKRRDVSPTKEKFAENEDLRCLVVSCDDPQSENGMARGVVEIKVKKIDADAKIPTKASVGSVGLDLYSNHESTIDCDEQKVISTGCAVEIPDGHYG